MAQVETVEAVGNAPAIIDTPGIDCLFFGANDVKLDMGLPLDVPEHECERLYAAMERTAVAAKRAGKWAGCVANSETMISLANQMGYSVLACGADQLFLREGSAAALRMARGAAAGRKTPALEVTLHTAKAPAPAPARV
jgi:2-keto-3-deoxy-L-rhamnonate aldolase RhmA